MTIRLRRSALYTPASNARALAKAQSLAADTTIIDLEDAVAPEMKIQARAAAVEAIRTGDRRSREIVLRVNALDSEWGRHDLEAAAACAPDAVLIPKVSEPSALVEAAAALRAMHAPAHVRLWAMIETPRAILEIAAIARLASDPSHRLDVFVIGANDLVKDLRARDGAGRLAILPCLSAAIVAARAYGLDILDGVFNDVSDVAGFAAECAQGRTLGMDGKTLIHPNQISACNEAFSPGVADVEAARALVAVFDRPENAQRGAIAIDGRMVERLHAESARRVLALAAAIDEARKN